MTSAQAHNNITHNAQQHTTVPIKYRAYIYLTKTILRETKN